MFVRFSTVAGERGSTDTARDVRGFAVKFYTDEGNWDLVGNNIPVFFIQDAMKFPDLVHAVKPEPHHAMPQAASAHDTFWDFVSLMPESTHMLMWVMSDRAIPRSYRMMQGFGVHTFRLVNAEGESRFVQVPLDSRMLGTHSLVWDEAVKISGADPDFHRRDLWEAIEAGDYPRVGAGRADLHRGAGRGLQLRRARRRRSSSPRSWCRCTPVGPDGAEPQPRQLLRRDRAGGVLHRARRARASTSRNDPLLAGPHPLVHRHPDLAPGRAELPRDPDQRAGRAGPQQPARRHAPAGHPPRPRRLRAELARRRLPVPGRQKTGFTSFPRADARRTRCAASRRSSPTTTRRRRCSGRARRRSSRRTSSRAFRFELTRVQTPAVRERMVAMLANVAAELAEGVAEGLGMALPEPHAAGARARRSKPEVTRSPALSLLARPGDGSIRGAAGRDCSWRTASTARRARALHASARRRRRGAALRRAAARAGARRGRRRARVEATLEAMPSVLFDALVLPDGREAIRRWRRSGTPLEFVRDQYRHCKPIVVLGTNTALLEAAAIPLALENGERDPGLLANVSPEAFAKAVAAHRYFQRESDPPRV